MEATDGEWEPPLREDKHWPSFLPCEYRGSVLVDSGLVYLLSLFEPETLLLSFGKKIDRDIIILTADADNN